MFEGENWSEKCYAVAGDILDGYLYDLFMNMLEERGVNRDFAEKLSDYCSGYEHSLYISLLEDLQKFVKWEPNFSHSTNSNHAPKPDLFLLVGF